MSKNRVIPANLASLDENASLGEDQMGIDVKDADSQEYKKEPQADLPSTKRLFYKHHIYSPLMDEINPFAYEGLDEGTPDFPWVPPSLDWAEQNRKDTMFNRGEAHLWWTKHDDMLPLGFAPVFYLRLLKYLGWIFVFFTLLSLPTLYLIHAFSEAQAGDMGLSFMTLGGIGDGSSSAETLVTLTQNEVAYLVTFTDLLQWFCVLFLWLFLKRRLRAVKAKEESTQVKASDFAVFVRKLPKDASEGEIKRHFSDLFQLSEPDWDFVGYFCGLCCRKRSRLPQDLLDSGDVYDGEFIKPVDPVDPCRPVADVSNSLNDAYLGSWVAEVSVVKRQGSAIRRYLVRKKLEEKLRTLRGIMKKYSVDTPYRRGPNLAKKSRAMKTAGKLIDKITQLKSAVAGGDPSTAGAYVIFNHEESMLRCLEDYKRSSSFLGRWFQPLPLRFRQKFALKVERAPEPREVLWENVDAKPAVVCCSRLVSFSGALLLLLATLMTMSFLHSNRNVYADVLPAQELCKRHIPAAVFTQYLTYENPTILRSPGARYCDEPSNYHISFEYPKPLTAWTYDPQNITEAGIDNILYPDIVARDEDITPRRTTNSFGEQVLPELTTQPTDKCFGPCISRFDLTGECASLTCPDGDPVSTPGWFTIDPVRYACTRYPAISIVHCYCEQELRAGVEASGFLAAAISLATGDDSDICQEYAFRYGFATSIPYLVGLLILLSNYLFKKYFKAVRHFERHASQKSQDRAALKKIAFFQLLNTCLALFVIWGRLPNGKLQLSLSSFFHFFSGDHEGITPGWYSDVGEILLFVVLLQVFIPPWFPIIREKFCRPMHQRCTRKKAVSQLELNALYEGCDFDTLSRHVSLLLMLSLFLLLGPALPYMSFFCALYCLLNYWVNRYLLLRYCKLLPYSSDSFARIIISFIPWLLLFHCLYAGYTYYGTKMAPNAADLSMIGLAESTEASNELWESIISAMNDVDPFQFASVLSRENTVFHGVLFVALIVGGIVYNTIGKTVKMLVSLCFCKRCCRDITVLPGRLWLPPYTQTYVRELTPKEEFELLDEEFDEGWILETTADNRQSLSKAWLEDGIIGGVPHRLGQRKRTWEVIRDEQLHSYKLVNNPKYKNAVVKISQKPYQRGIDFGT